MIYSCYITFTYLSTIYLPTLISRWGLFPILGVVILGGIFSFFIQIFLICKCILFSLRNYLVMSYNFYLLKPNELAFLEGGAYFKVSGVYFRWYLFFILIQILIKHSVSKQWRA